MFFKERKMYVCDTVHKIPLTKNWSWLISFRVSLSILFDLSSLSVSLVPPAYPSLHSLVPSISSYLYSSDSLCSVYLLCLFCSSPTAPCPVSWGCRIHWLHLCRGARLPPYECPGYDTKQSDGEVPAMLELWGMWSTPSLPLLPGPLWPGVVAPDKGPIYGLNRINSILMLKWIVWVKLNSLK